MLIKLSRLVSDRKTVGEWMLTDGVFERIHGRSHLYVRIDDVGRIFVIVEKVTDDFISGGSIRTMKVFIDEMKKRFEVGKVIINDYFLFNGFEIEPDGGGSVKMIMNRYMDQVKEIPMCREKTTTRRFSC